MRVLPNSIVGLLEELEADFPPKCKNPDETLEEHMMYAGKVAMIKLLRLRYEAELRQNKKGLPNVLS